MIRGFALASSFILLGAAPALAQAHSRPHPQVHLHGPGHTRPDSAAHAAMHAMLHGSWTGTFWSARGDSSAMHMSVAHDSPLQVTLRMSTDQPMRAGEASDFVMGGDELQWTQDLSGASCKAAAVVSHAAASIPEMKGRMQCELGEVTFTLHKKAG